MPLPVDAKAVLFDLDGTLIDSAPDLLAALDHVRSRRGLAGADHGRLREHVSRGAAGLIDAGLGELPSAEHEAARRELLEHYENHCWERSRPFDGVETMLAGLQARGLALGVVTNKISRFAEPVMAQAGWSRRFGCLVTGDRVERPKPDPEPVETACRELGIAAQHCVFVGDDRRDVLAGKAAGVATIVAAWGYLPRGERAEDWGADAIIAAPAKLSDLLSAGGSRETA